MEELVFTKHIRQYRDGETPDDAAYRLMAAILKKKLREKGLLSRPPTLLDVKGDSWLDEETFGELLNACYEFAIIDRIRGLMAQLDVKPNIEGLVSRNINNFIVTRRRTADPRGFDIGQALKRAVNQLIEARDVLPPENSRIRNSFVVRTSPAQTVLKAEEIPDLLQSDGGWNKLMNHFHSTTIDERLAQKIRQVLSTAGFRFGDFVWAVRSVAKDFVPVDVKAGEKTDWDAAEKGFSSEIRMILPDGGYDNLDAAKHAINALKTKVETLSGRGRKVKERIQRLLSYLERKIEKGEIDEKTTQSVFARELGVSTSTLSEDIKQLRELF